jgi:phage gp46-like protein
MDIKLQSQSNGIAAIVASDTETTVINAIYMSLAVPQGGWWFDPNFGSKLCTLRRAKATQATANMVKTYVQSALQWLVDSGKLSEVDVTVEIAAKSDTQPKGRINYIVVATQPDGNKLEYSNFVEVA